MSSPPTRTFRFRPRYRPLAYAAVGVGVVLLIAALAFGLTGASLYFAVATGIIGPALGAFYMASPAWRLRVVVDDEGFEVGSDSKRRFRLLWTDVRRVIASPDTKTCFVDGGDPSTSLMVPGPGADAPYDIENKHELYALVVSRVGSDRLEEVELLETADLSGE